MRAIAFRLLIALIVGAGLGGCGEVKAKPDAGGNTGGSDAATPDADMSGGCTANSYSCGNDDALYQCDGEGESLTKVQDCQYGCSVDHCNECDANTTFCSGSDLVTCDANGNITNPQSCEHGCQMDRCNTCDPGVAYCDSTNANAVTCGLDGEPGASMSCGSAGCQGGVCNTCTPSTTSCQGDKLVVCKADGSIQNTTDCALGCANTPNAHCRALVPSYGVPAPSGTLPNLVVNANATLDISNCSGSPGSVDLTINGTTMSIVGSPQVLLKTQPSGNPPICIVRFGTIAIDSGTTLTVTNAAAIGHSLSLQAVGDIGIAGTISFTNAADGLFAGHNVMVLGTNSNNKYMAAGAGGAGAARTGGTGGMCMSCGSGNAPGGIGGAAVTTSSTILMGGSAGGSVMSGATILGKGGRGGGGIQIVSLTRVTLSATATIALNGGGGVGPASGAGWLTAGGGGSGGTLAIEAPAISLSAGAIAVANGGGGAGGCTEAFGFGSFKHVNGQPGQLSDVRAAGGDCPVAGDGGFEANGAASPSINGSSSDAGCVSGACGGGGGGSSGFVYLRGRSAASVMIAGGATISPQPSLGAVMAN